MSRPSATRPVVAGTLIGCLAAAGLYAALTAAGPAGGTLTAQSSAPAAHPAPTGPSAGGSAGTAPQPQGTRPPTSHERHSPRPAASTVDVVQVLPPTGGTPAGRSSRHCAPTACGGALPSATPAPGNSTTRDGSGGGPEGGSNSEDGSGSGGGSNSEDGSGSGGGSGGGGGSHQDAAGGDS